jgi:beta-1,4-mannosyl-glycoprotein beta-1,4-N-acetylglucosaminyltransferase
VKKIDTFCFYNELDLLEIRLEYLYDYIDYFILVEAAYTQLGDPKIFYFEENKERYAKYLNKIIHIKINEEPQDKTYGTWTNENYQRNQIVRGFKEIQLIPSDVIIISDLDEIPKIEAIQSYINNNLNDIRSVNQDIYYYFLNAKAPFQWQGPQICRFDIFLKGATPQQLRNNRVGFPCIENRKPMGWHFAYQGGAEMIFKKINSICEAYAHETHNKDIDKLKKEIEANNLYFIDNHKLTIVPLDDSFPPNITNNREKYKHMIKEI